MFPRNEMLFQPIYVTLGSVASAHIRKRILDLDLDNAWNGTRIHSRLKQGGWTNGPSASQSSRWGVLARRFLRWHSLHFVRSFLPMIADPLRPCHRDCPRAQARKKNLTHCGVGAGGGKYLVCSSRKEDLYNIDSIHPPESLN